VTFAERLVEKRSLWGRFPTRITSGDLAQSAVLGSPQEEQLCKTDPDTKRAACRDRGLKPPKFVKVPKSVFSEEYNRFCHLLIEARKAAKLTQAELSAKL
jgi:hypothetical protein